VFATPFRTNGLWSFAHLGYQDTKTGFLHSNFFMVRVINQYLGYMLIIKNCFNPGFLQLNYKIGIKNKISQLPHKRLQV
jgi:hypothetical protein